jgi:hypothetical protein
MVVRATSNGKPAMGACWAAAWTKNDGCCLFPSIALVAPRFDVNCWRVSDRRSQGNGPVVGRQVSGRTRLELFLQCVDMRWVSMDQNQGLGRR